MNKQDNTSQDSHKTFLLLSEIEKGERLSQRELANRLGIALGLVNSYLKNLVTKGFVRVKAFPRNRYGYLLTPQGFAEKSRLAYQHLNYFTNLYTTTRKDYLDLFRHLENQGVRNIAFCGVDEVAEIAYLSLQETGLDLRLVMDDCEQEGRELFGHPVLSLSTGLNDSPNVVVLSSLKRGAALRERLHQVGWQGQVHGPAGLSASE